MKIKRREFLEFFLFSGLISLILKRFSLKSAPKVKEAMFWRRKG